MLQKQEQKQFQDLTFKSAFARDQQEVRFKNERINLLKTFEMDLENIVRMQRQQVGFPIKHI